MTRTALLLLAALAPLGGFAAPDTGNTGITPAVHDWQAQGGAWTLPADKVVVAVSSKNKDALTSVAKALRADKASVSVAGSGDVTVNTSRELDASVSGSGNVLYRGGPTQVRKNVSGSGVVRDISGPGGRAY